MTSIAAAQKSNLNEYAVASVIRELQTEFAGRVVTSLAVREQHGNTVTWVKAEPPDAVVFPHSTQEVSANRWRLARTQHRTSLTRGDAARQRYRNALLHRRCEFS